MMVDIEDNWLNNRMPKTLSIDTNLYWLFESNSVSYVNTVGNNDRVYARLFRIFKMFDLVGSRCTHAIQLSRFRLKRENVFKVLGSKIDKVSRTISKSGKIGGLVKYFQYRYLTWLGFEGHNHCSKCQKNVNKIALFKCIRKLITCAKMLQFNPYHRGGKQLTRIHPTCACDSTFLSTADSGWDIKCYR